jgi:hypothetical protein
VSDTPALVDAPITERDWHAKAWERLRDVRARHLGWTLDDALAHRTIGPVVRGFGAQLRRQWEVDQLAAAKAARFGQKVQHTGYGYAPVPRKFKP